MDHRWEPSDGICGASDGNRVNRLIQNCLAQVRQVRDSETNSESLFFEVRFLKAMATNEVRAGCGRPHENERSAQKSGNSRGWRMLEATDKIHWFQKRWHKPKDVLDVGVHINHLFGDCAIYSETTAKWLLGPGHFRTDA